MYVLRFTHHDTFKTLYKFSTKAHEPVACRLHKIYSETLEIISEQRPDIVILEDIYSLAKYPRSGIILGKVSGVISLAA
ncbi:crossover junction endodeoxyribonuclease RuvC, partial [bacterium]|nr:crossover junction endodeoxyribonuclease RuvC [bacterium]